MTTDMQTAPRQMSEYLGWLRRQLEATDMSLYSDLYVPDAVEDQIDNWSPRQAYRVGYTEGLREALEGAVLCIGLAGRT